MIRKAAVSGQFYPKDPWDLKQSILGYIGNNQNKKVRAKAVILPHAGYMYSGHVAGAVMGSVEVPKVALILGPNHHGRGKTFALMYKGAWETPLGIVPLEEKLGKLLLEQTDLIKEDPSAHQFEHSLEVEVPFLQVLRPDIRILPITCKWCEFSLCEAVGKAIGNVIRSYDEEILIVASTDMTHYESADNAQKKDQMAIEQILSMNPKGLFETVFQNNITMCGVIPTTITLVAAKEIGATSPQLVKYATSGDVSGDYNQVVGYAGLYII